MNQDMTKGPILSVLLKFTIPIMLGNLFQQFYNICDTIIVGRTLGADSLAAVGATGTISFLILGFAMGLSSGFSVVTSQKFGAGDEEGVRLSMTNGSILMLILGTIVTVFSVIFMRPILRLMNTPSDIFEYAHSYIVVICIGLLGTVAYNLFSSNLRAIGNSRVPLYFLVFSSFLNIILDLVFILAFHWGVAGAAWATILSQLVSAVLCWIYIIKKEPLLTPRREDWKLRANIVNAQLYIGLPMGLQYAITASGTMIMQSATNIFGSVAVAANTAAGKVSGIFTSIFMSFGQSIATYIGQNFGKNDRKRIRKGLKLSVMLSSGYAVIAGIVLCALLPYELELFFSGGDNMAMILPYAKVYAYLAALFYIPLGLIFIFRNAMQSCNHSMLAMAAGITELITRVICAELAIKFHTFWLACFCDPAAWLVAGIYTTVAFYISAKKDERVFY